MICPVCVKEMTVKETLIDHKKYIQEICKQCNYQDDNLILMHSEFN